MHMDFQDCKEQMDRGGKVGGDRAVIEDVGSCGKDVI